MANSTAWNIAFWLNPTYWGRGLASEAIEAAVVVGLGTLRVPAVRAIVADWNQRSLSTLKRLGFEVLGTIAHSPGVREAEPTWELELTHDRWQVRR